MLDALKELDDYHVSLEVLERTGVGIVVNKLRKSQFPEVARLAQAKVLDWKAVAKVGIDRRNSSKALDPWYTMLRSCSATPRFSLTCTCGAQVWCEDRSWPWWQHLVAGPEAAAAK